MKTPPLTLFSVFPGLQPALTSHPCAARIAMVQELGGPHVEVIVRGELFHDAESHAFGLADTRGRMKL